jgi:hypothetical protein
VQDKKNRRHIQRLVTDLIDSALPFERIAVVARKACTPVHRRHRIYTIAMCLSAVGAAALLVRGLTMPVMLGAHGLSVQRWSYPVAMVALMCDHRRRFLREDLHRRCVCW